MHKGGDIDDCSSYRPIILKSISLKTLESALRDRRVEHLSASKLSMVEQPGIALLV